MSESESQSFSLTINGSPIWYEKFGYGARTILLIPGGIGLYLIFYNFFDLVHSNCYSKERQELIICHNWKTTTLSISTNLP